jgi:hypothetical protein
MVAFIGEDEVMARSFKVIELLHELPISQALGILREARDMILASHVVDTSAERFKSMKQEFSFCSPE